jgi:hypothetical protein
MTIDAGIESEEAARRRGRRHVGILSKCANEQERD